MSKANQKLNGLPESGGNDRVDKAKSKSRVGFMFALCMFVSMVLIGPASANATVDWTEISTMLDGVTTIFPSIGGMVTGIVPTLLVLAIVGFILRFFDAIIKAITNAVSFIK